MNKYIQSWEDIKNNNIEYNKISLGVSSDVYITDNLVFKQKDNYNNLISEIYAIKELYRSNINVPELKYFSKTHNIAVFEYIEGCVLNDLKNKNIKNIPSKIGTQLRNIHSLDYKTYGDFVYQAGTLIGKYEDYNKFVNSFCNTFKNLDDSIFQDIVIKCKEIIKSNNIKYEKPTSILHLDYHSENILRDINQKLYTIDFEHSILGPKEMDIIQSYLIFRYTNGQKFAEKFLDGYGINIIDINICELCLGILHECRVGIWWENEMDRDMTKRYNKLSEFVNETIDL